MDVTAYSLEAPPEPSPRLAAWLGKVRSGWRPNRRVRAMDTEGQAGFYGVYLWEFVNVLRPALDEALRRE